MGDVDVRTCPYKGDGLAGWGKLMEGFSRSHGQRDKCEETIKDTIDKVVVGSERNITHLTGAYAECLANYLKKACYDYLNNYWTKDQAVEDVKDIHDAIFYKYKHESVPEILNKQCMHGLYNDTSTQMILDRAYVESVFAATTITMDTIHKYFEHFRALASIVIDGLNVAIQDATKDTLDQTTDRDIKETTNNRYHHEDSLNIGALGMDMAIIIIAAFVLEAFLTLSYGACQ